MEYFPLGDLIEERYELSKKYNLVDFVDGKHTLTQKCKNNYSQLSYLGYLKGDLERPTRIKRKTTPQKSSREDVLQEILNL